MLIAADSTPGMALTLSKISFHDVRIRAGSVVTAGESPTPVVNTFFGSNHMSTDRSREMVRSIKPDPASKTKASATCVTTSPA